MRFYSDHRDNGPIYHVGRVPVYVATIITALYCAGMIATAMMESVHGRIYLFDFSTDSFLRHFWLWQIFTFTFVNEPDINFLFAIFIIYACGRDIEQFFGRWTFLKFFALEILAIALVLCAWHLLDRPSEYAGMFEVAAGLFVGYATLYPDLQWFGLVPMKYVAAAFMAVFALRDLANNLWLELSVLAVICAFSFSFIRHVKLGGSIEFGEWARKLNPFRRRPKFRVMPPPDRPVPRSGGSAGSAASVDAILDKIARDGFASLTQDERDQLERAREILNKKRH